MTSSMTGARGEQIAAAHLEKCGWTIVNRNFRVGHKEIDLIVRRGDVLAFVEVKTRRGNRFGHPLASIVAAKRMAIQQVAENWIALFGGGDLQYRFDAIAILWGARGGFELQHVENAWGI